jgi:hypothetical protein
MKTILKIVTVLLITVTFISCGTSSYLEVRERPSSHYYYRSERPEYWSTPPSHYYRGPGYWRAAPHGGYYYRRVRWHR